MPSVVQSQGGIANPGVAVSVVLPNIPQPGNVLYAEFSLASGRSPDLAGWTVIEPLTTNVTCVHVSAWRKVQAGDSKTWTFNISGGSEYCGCIITELTGVDSNNPMNAHLISPLTFTNPSQARDTPLATPTVVGCLATASLSTDNGAVDSVAATSSAGWTATATVSPDYHKVFVVAKDVVTADTVTALKNTFTVTSGVPFPIFTSIILWNPGSSLMARFRRMARIRAR